MKKLAKLLCISRKVKNLKANHNLLTWRRSKRVVVYIP